jgi:anti-sigma factor RsiW
MNCQECYDYIDAYLDDELEVSATIVVRQHLRGCSNCQQILESRKALEGLLDRPQVSFQASDSLFGKVHSVLAIARTEGKQISSRKFAIPFPRFSVPLAWAATIAVMLGLVFLNRGSLFDRSQGDALAREVISSHLRSLLGTHLLDVPSADQHTVKPWFDGKLSFAPPVHDLADHGFPLIGGRLDYCNGREVAALIYQRKLHVINLFIWPSESGGNKVAEGFTKDGYQVSHWDRDGFTFWAVSDVNAEDLKIFADLEMQSP